MRNSEFTFKFKEPIVRNSLLSGIVYTILGILSFVFPNVYFFNFVFLFFGGFFFVQWYRRKKFGYIILSTSSIVKHYWWPNKILLKDITGIRYYVGEIRILSNTKTLRIEKEFLSDQDLELLEEKVKQIVFGMQEPKIV